MSALDRFMRVADKAIRFPHSALRIAELADQLDSPNHLLVAQVEEDPAFVAQLLRLVNSSAFPGQRDAPVTSLENALVRVGRQKVAELALLQASTSAFSTIESTLLRATTFWTHCQQTAVVARRLAAYVGISESDCYVAGLLHDIGLLLMFHTEPQKMEFALDFSLDESISLVEAEKELLGVSHPELGGHLATAWNLPSTLSSAIRFHHTPWELTVEVGDETEHSITTCVALANEISGDPESSGLEDSPIVEYAQQQMSFSDIDLLHVALAGCREVEASEPIS